MRGRWRWSCSTTGIASVPRRLWGHGPEPPTARRAVASLIVGASSSPPSRLLPFMPPIAAMEVADDHDRDPS